MTATVNMMKRLVGNPDAYALQHDDGSWHPVREHLSDEVLATHLTGDQTVGTYVGHGSPTVSRTLVVDIDEDDTILAHRVSLALRELGCPDFAVSIEFSGKKGYHVWLLLQDFVPNEKLRRLGRHALVLSDLPPKTEVFPKQDEVRDLGNLVKLPEGIHRVSKNPNPFLDGFPRPMPVAVLDTILGTLPEEVKVSRGVSDVRFPCMTAIQEEGASTGARNIQLFHLATLLRRNGVSDPNIDTIMRRANDIGDPIDDDELEGILRGSMNAGPLCEQIPEDRHCGELCIKYRTSGLYTRPGQLRFAGEGENVVVTLTRRSGEVIEFSHDDIRTMKGRLRGRDGR